MRLAGPRDLALPIAFALFALFAALPAAAQDVSALRARAQSEALAGRCAEALGVIAKAGEAAQTDGGLLLVAGQCQIRAKQYAQARTSLEQARSIDPNLPNVDLSLGIARYHMGDLDGAAEALAAARARGDKNAELDLYEGLVMLQRADARDAAASLERARISDPGVEPVASFYSGLAFSSLDDRTEAREALERVIAQYPGTQWADAAQRALDDLDSRAPHKWLRIGAGLEYDTNVLLQGAGVTTPSDISNKSALGGVWWADGGLEFLRTDQWSAGIRAHYYGNAYVDLSSLDQQYPGVGLWLDRRMDEATTLRLEYDYSYAWVGYEPYLSAQTATVSVLRNWGAAGSTVVRALASQDNYFFPRDTVPEAGQPGVNCRLVSCAPPGTDSKAERNADGYGFSAGVEHGLPLDWNDSTITAGYDFLYYYSRGQEWRYSGHQLWLGFHTALPWKVRLHTLGSYTYRAYENSSTYPNPGAEEQAQRLGQPYRLVSAHRRDNALDFDLVLERPILKWLTASIRYNYLWNDSNTDVFHYHRQIVGGYLTVYLHD